MQLAWGGGGIFSQKDEKTKQFLFYLNKIEKYLLNTGNCLNFNKSTEIDWVKKFEKVDATYISISDLSFLL